MARLIVLLAATGLLQAQNWPMFRGAGASGVADGQNLPNHWNVESSENVLWKTAIPGMGHSSPVIWGNRLFVTTALSSDPSSVFQTKTTGQIDRRSDASKHTWRLFCLDKQSGTILWQKKVYEGEPRIHRHQKNSYASATPATDGKYIVAMFGSEGLYAFTSDGDLLWKQDLGIIDSTASYDETYTWGPASSPVIFRNLVIVLADGHRGSFLAAFDLATGKPVWRKERNLISSFATPNIYEGKDRAELVTNGAGTIISYDPRTGEELWRLKGSSMNTTRTPVFAHDLFFVASGYRIRPVFAIRPGAKGDISLAEGSASNASVAWSSQRDGPYMATPLVYGEYLYLLHTNGALACYRAKTGEPVYRQRVGEGADWFFASPVAADGKLYIPAESGDLYVVKAGATLEVLAKNPMQEVIMATPALSEGRMYIRTMGRVYAIGRK